MSSPARYIVIALLLAASLSACAGQGGRKSDSDTELKAVVADEMAKRGIR